MAIADATPGSAELASLGIRRYPGEDCPTELVELRRLVWEQEMGLLPEGGLLDANDRRGVHLLVYDGERLIASACAVEAEESDFAEHTRFPGDVLRDTMFLTRSTVHP